MPQQTGVWAAVVQTSASTLVRRSALHYRLINGSLARAQQRPLLSEHVCTRRGKRDQLKTVGSTKRDRSHLLQSQELRRRLQTLAPSTQVFELARRKKLLCWRDVLMTGAGAAYSPGVGAMYCTTGAGIEVGTTGREPKPPIAVTIGAASAAGAGAK